MARDRHVHQCLVRDLAEPTARAEHRQQIPRSRRGREGRPRQDSDAVLPHQHVAFRAYVGGDDGREHIVLNELESLVRRVDEDRWLASRFAPPPARERLVAVYAVAHEIARIPWLVKEANLGAIRLAWWRDALAALHAGEQAEQHPALSAYARHASTLPDVWPRLIEATAAWIAPALACWDDADALIERSHVPIIRIAAAAADARAQLDDAFVRTAARAWGYVECFLAGRASLLPGDAAQGLLRTRNAYAEARGAPALPSSLFPALGQLCLTPLYLRAFSRGQRAVPLLRRQLRLVAAAATGRL
ncbi:MAG: squalene/phytoene synthase family protein [Hyphomonadaceae bacterium]|nr:squalene/phytoene synthase family protein [Hyphomonadaceae bacterium]